MFVLESMLINFINFHFVYLTMYSSPGLFGSFEVCYSIFTGGADPHYLLHLLSRSTFSSQRRGVGAVHSMSSGFNGISQG